jgi:hypothetical protein
VGLQVPDNMTAVDLRNVTVPGQRTHVERSYPKCYAKIKDRVFSTNLNCGYSKGQMKD